MRSRPLQLNLLPALPPPQVPILRSGERESEDQGAEEGRGAALLFDHVLIDDGGDDGQGDDVPGGGQNLCDFFVLEKR